MQKTAYEMRISDWSSDVCSSDLTGCGPEAFPGGATQAAATMVGCLPRRRQSPQRMLQRSRRRPAALFFRRPGFAPYDVIGDACRRAFRCFLRSNRFGKLLDRKSVV